MSLTLKRGSVTSTTNYTTSDNDLSFRFSVTKNGTTVQNISGSFSKGGTELGTFNYYNGGQQNLNFNKDVTTSDKNAIVADVDDIISQIVG